MLIHAAALELYAEQGVRGVSLDTIAARVGCSRATVVNYTRPFLVYLEDIILESHGVGDT